MKKSNFKFSTSLIATFLFILFQLNLIGQCPTASHATCSMSAGQYDNVVLGELSGDSGQSDGCNDAIVEIVGPPGTVIGCMVVSNSEWAVLIPPGTMIGADGVFLIACSQDASGASCGVGGSFGTGNGQYANGDGDFNNGIQAEIDLDVCLTSNASFYDPAATGFTLDNSGSTDGDQVMIWRPNGAIHDGIYWGTTNVTPAGSQGPGGKTTLGGASGASDHVSIQVAGQTYTLGDNDGNGNVNDNPSTVPGGRGDTGNATAVPVLPTDAGCPCNTPGSPGTFTMPSLSDSDFWFDMNGNSATYVGCNSSYGRVGTNAGSHGNPSHMDGLVTSTTADPITGQPTDNGGGASGNTGDGWNPTGYTPTSCVADPTSAIANEWGYTDHPTPGVANNEPAFVFYGDNFSICDAATETVTFTVEIYNYQHVSDNMDVLSGTANGQAGSYVYNPITGMEEIWDTYTVSGETTTMTYTLSSADLMAAGAGTHQFGLVWDDYSNCCGTSGDPHSQSNPNECYEVSSLEITIVEPLMATDTDIQCPTDAAEGSININDFISGGTALSFTMVDDAGVLADVTNSSGVFSLEDNATAGPYTVTITDGSGCSTPVVINIADNCEKPPVCPSALVNTGTTVDGPLCPGDMITLCLDGVDLPQGGEICWYELGTSGATPDDTTDTELGCVTIPTIASSTPSGSPVVNEVLYDPAGEDGNDGCEAVEIAGTPGTDISCYMITDGDFAVTIPDGTMIPADGFFVIASGGCGDATPEYSLADIDLITNGCGCTDGTGESFNLTNSGEFIALYDDSGVLIDGIIFEETVNSDNNGPNGQSEGVTNPAGCTNSSPLNIADVADVDNPPSPWNWTSGATNESIERVDDVTGVWQAHDGTGSNTIGAPNNTPIPMPIPCLDLVLDNSYCSGDIFINSLISGVSSSCPAGDNVGLPSDYSMACPDAVIIASSFEVCADEAPVMIPVTITGGTGPYTLVYAINGTAHPALTGFNSGDNISIATASDDKITLVSVTDEMGGMCSGTVNDAEVCVNITPTQTLTITGSSQPSTCSPCDGSVTFDMDGGATSTTSFDIDYSFNGSIFSLGSVTMPFTLNHACPGEYDIVAAIAADAGCMMTVVSNAQELIQAIGDPIMINAQPATLCNDGTEDLDLSTVDMTPAFAAGTHTFYSVDPNTLPAFALASAQLDPSLTGLTANQTIWVLYTDANGCSSVAQINVVVSSSVCCDPPVLTSAINATCPSESQGDVDLTTTGGIGALTYSWTGPSSFTATTQDLTNVAAGTYDLTVTVGGNTACTVIGSYAVSEFTAPAITAMTTNTTTCGGTNGTMTLSGLTAGASYTISYTGPTGVPASGSVTMANASGQIVVSGLSAGMYSAISVTDANGCMSNELMASLADPTSPTVDAPANQSICNGEASSAINFTGSTGATFNWTNSNTSIGLAASGTGNIPSFITTNSTSSDVTATIIVTPTMSGCTGMAQMMTITVYASPQVTGDIGPSCATGTNGSIDVSTTGNAPFAYAWSDGSVLEDRTGLDNGIYSLTVTDDNNCTTTTSFQVDDFAKVNCVASNSGPVCTGGFVDLEVMLGGGLVTVGGYSWSGPGGFTSTTQNPTINPAVAGVYTVTVSYGGPTMDQCEDICMTTVVVNPLPTLSDAQVCEGSTVMMTGSGTAASTAYVSSNMTVATVTNSGIVSGIMAGTSIITYTDINGCEVSATVTVTTASDAGTGSSTTICETSTTSIDLTTLLSGSDTGGTWTAGTNPAGGTFVASAGTFDPTGAGVGTHSFNYTIAATGGCPISEATVSIVIENQAEAGTDGMMTLCAPATTAVDLFSVITGEDAGGVWTETTVPSSGALTGSSFDPSGITMGSYTFQYSFAAGTACLADMATATITLMDQPEAGMGSATSVCASETADEIILFDLISGGDMGGTWTANTGNPSGGTFMEDDGAFNPSDAPAGVYMFTYSFALAAPCMADDAVVMVEVLEVPDAPMLSDVEVCDGAAIEILPEPTMMTAMEIFTEDFEGDPATLVTGEPQFTDGNFDFFTVTDGTNITGAYSVTGYNGSSYFAAMDIDGEGGGSPNTLSFTGINIAGKTNLSFSGLFAEDDEGAGHHWDASDYVHIDYQIDGSGYMPLLWFENDGTTFNEEPLQDTNFDGTGDGAALSFTFSSFSAAISGTGNLLDLRITIALNSGDEDIAIDDLKVTGDMPATTTCAYRVYDESYQLVTSVILADGVSSYSPVVAAGDSEDFFVTQICSNGCESMESKMTVTVNALPTCTAGSNSAICDGGSINLTETGGDAVSWSWTGPNSFSSTDQNPSIANVTSAEAGTYTVSILDAKGCASSCDVIVSVNANPTIITGFANPSTCAGTDGAIAILGLVPSSAYTVNYTGTSGTPASGSMATSDPSGLILISGLSAGMYTNISVTNSNMCTSNVNAQTLSDPNSPTVNALTNVSACDGSAISSISFSGTTGATFAWTNDTPSIGLSASGTGDIASFIGSNSTAAPVVATISVTPSLSGCTGMTEIFTVTVNPKPMVDAGIDASVCEGLTATIAASASSSAGIMSYAWNATSGTFNDNAIEDPVYTNATPGAYTLTLTVTDNNGCVSSDQVVVTVVDEKSAGSDGTASICNAIDPVADPSALINLFSSLGGTPATGGTWTETSTVSSGVSLTSPTSVSFEYVNAGTYTFDYEVSNATPCIAARATVTVTVTDCFDLALAKDLKTTTAVVAGDMVAFTINVYNQGTVDAYDVIVSDYVPSDLLFTAVANTAALTGNANNWAAAGANATYMIDHIPAGGSVPVDIILQIDPAFTGTLIINDAEITFASNKDGGTTQPDDEDSITNDNFGNASETATDNDIDDDSTGGLDNAVDEDDFDPAAVMICPTITITAQPENIYVCQSSDGNVSISASSSDGSALTFELQESTGGAYTTISTNSADTDGTETALFAIANVNMSSTYQILVSSASSTSPNCPAVSDIITATIVAELPLVCNAHLNVSVNSICEIPTTIETLLEGENSDPAFNASLYSYMFLDDDGNVIAESDLGDYLNQTITFKVTSNCSPNSCWGTITIEDKLPPVLTCPNDVTIDCFQSSFPFSPAFMEANYMTDNCDDATVYIVSDNTDNIECNDAAYPDFTAIRTICYQAEDAQGSVSNECCFRVFYERVDYNDIVFPANVTENCAAYPVWNSNTILGVPTITTANGTFNITPGSNIPCAINSVYSDEIIPLCGSAYKVLRNWTVLDWCSANVDQHTQIIKVEPDGLFVTTNNSQYVANTNGYGCQGSWAIPLSDLAVMGICNAEYTYEVLYLSSGIDSGAGNCPTSFSGVFTQLPGTYNSNQAAVINDLMIGCNWVKIRITTECGETEEISVEVYVQDVDQPYAVCEEHTVTTLGADGFALVHATSLDDGSFDDCGEVTVGIRRLSNFCSFSTAADVFGIYEGNLYLSAATFCCSDLGTDVPVELIVVDESGNYNICNGYVQVEDVSEPIFTCPDLMVTANHSCDFNANPSFGTPSYTMGSQICSDVYTVVQVENSRSTPDDCGDYRITNKWNIINNSTNGVVHTCAQVINMINTDLFAGSEINWPQQNISLIGCINEDTDPDKLGEPQYFPSACQLVAHTYKDETFTSVNGACFEILRTWTVIDWCQYDANTPSGPGIWTFTQVIEIKDNTAPNPIVNSPVFEITDDSCSAFGTISINGNDNCGTLNYMISLNGGSSYINLGANNNYSSTWQNGTNSVLWKVSDMCGNETTATQTITVVDRKAPTPYCLGIITTVLMPSTQSIEIWASDFDLGSEDNCDSVLDITFANGSANMTFDCDDLGPQVLQIFYWDDAGNSDFCTVVLDVQDNSGVCTGARIAGTVYTEEDEMMEDVEIQLMNQSSEIPNFENSIGGEYAFEDVNLGDHYNVTAHKDDDYMNGVSTLDLVLIQKHILESQLLDSPYKVIAADADNSGNVSAIDLIHLRKLILGIYTELPSNNSWRFVDADQQFANILEPWPFTENVLISPLQGISDDNDFVAVKIGDVNNTVVANATNKAVAENRSADLAFTAHATEQVGENQVIQVTSANFKDIVGFQGTLEFSDGFQLESIQKGALDVSEKNYSRKDNGDVSFSWNSQQALSVNEDETLFSLVMKAGANAATVQLEITDLQLRAEAYTSDLEIKGISMEMASGLSGAYALYQNEPNPFINKTMISFELPEDEVISLRIYSIDGKTLKTISKEMSKGYNTIELNRSELVGKGILYYSLEAGKFTATRKMIAL